MIRPKVEDDLNASLSQRLRRNLFDARAYSIKMEKYIFSEVMELDSMKGWDRIEVASNR